MIRLFIAVALLLGGDLYAQGAQPPLTEAQHEKTYEWRVRQQELYGVYIPQDLGEVFVQLTLLSDASDRAKFARLSEREAVTVPFFSLGRWMSHNWGFYGGSRLTVYLNELKLHHPDDMTRFLLVMFHRHLNKKKLDPQPVIDGLLGMRQAAEQDRALQGEVIHEETRQLDSIPPPKGRE
ncbi:MAG: DUF6794 domain-containing protein [Bacteroidota bacterium]